MRILNDPLYMEPKPERHHGIFCFTCKKRVQTKAQAAKNHEGHDCDYLGADGKRMN